MEVLKLAAQRLLSHPHLYALPAAIPGLKLGEMVYHPPREPRAISAGSAAILRWTLPLESHEVSGRCARAKDILSRSRGIADITPVRPIRGGESGFLRLALIDNSGSLAPRKDLGALRGYPMTLDQHPQLRPVLLSGERAGKGSKSLRDGLFTIPTHSQVGDADLARVADWLNTRELERHVLVPAS
jgi:hypothetical protein